MIINETKINLTVYLSLSIALSAIYLFVHSTGYYDISLRVLAAIGLIPALCMGMIMIKTKEIQIGVYFLVLFQTWTMFLEPYTWKQPIASAYRNFNSSDFPDLAFACVVSIYLLFIGLLNGIRQINVKPIFSSNRLDVFSLQKMLIFMMIFGFISVGIFSLGIRIGFLGLIDMMLPATVGAVSLLYILRGGRNIIIILLSILYMCYYFIYYIGGTLFIYSIYLIMAPTIVYILERKKIPYIALLSLIIAIMPIYLSRHEYRKVGLYSAGAVRMHNGFQILEKEYRNISVSHWKELYKKEQKDKNIDNRTEGVTYLATIKKSIDSGGKSYLYGSSIAWLPTMIIPRFLLPFRPSQNMGDEQAEYYGLKEKSWKASINFPMLCEFYANFGYLGMIILMYFNGLLIVWFVKKFNQGEGDMNLILFIFIVSKIIVVESNVTLSYGAILQVMLVCWLLKKFSLKKKE